MPQFKMPQLGESIVEGVITRWLKREGDSVGLDESLVEVSTDKVDSEIPSPYEGVVTKILAEEGATVAVGSPIAEIGESGTAAGSAKAAGTPAESKTREAVKEKPAVTASTPSTNGASRQAVLSPLVRKLAREKGVSLESVKGSGEGGRITKEDVMKAAGGGAVPSVGEPAHPKQVASDAKQRAESRPAPDYKDAQPARAAQVQSFEDGKRLVHVTTMRKAIAEHMVASLRETARAWNAVEVDMTKVGVLRAKAGEGFKASEGFSLTWTPFVAQAVTQTLREFPSVNATWNGDGTITEKSFVNLGIAVALDNGLIVPVIKGAEAMTIVGFARAVRDIATRARSKKLLPDDVAGGTFTITNPGPFGSVLSVPIINKGQAGILAMDAVVKRPVVTTDENGSDSIGVREMVYISMSWDHRIIDGAVAAQFLGHLKGLLERAAFDTELAGYLP